MLFNHHSVDSLGVPECQETKAPRAASSTIAHYGAFLYLSELGEVVSQRF